MPMKQFAYYDKSTCGFDEKGAFDAINVGCVAFTWLIIQIKTFMTSWLKMYWIE